MSSSADRSAERGIVHKACETSSQCKQTDILPLSAHRRRRVQL